MKAEELKQLADAFSEAIPSNGKVDRKRLRELLVGLTKKDLQELIEELDRRAGERLREGLIKLVEEDNRRAAKRRR